MLAGLTYAKKNKVLLAGTALLFLIAWFLAFSRTYDAVALNSQLMKQVEDKNDLSYNPAGMDEQLRSLNVALERFYVDSTNWKDEFWLNVSRVASSQDVEIIYEPQNAGQDSSRLVLNEAIQFTGKYRDLLLLLDSLEGVSGIGRIGTVEFARNKKLNSQPGHVGLLLRFYALNKQEFKQKF